MRCPFRGPFLLVFSLRRPITPTSTSTSTPTPTPTHAHVHAETETCERGVWPENTHERLKGNKVKEERDRERQRERNKEREREKTHERQKESKGEEILLYRGDAEKYPTDWKKGERARERESKREKERERKICKLPFGSGGRVCVNELCLAHI